MPAPFWQVTAGAGIASAPAWPAPAATLVTSAGMSATAQRQNPLPVSASGSYTMIA
jgi:hypothetical protein